MALAATVTAVGAPPDLAGAPPDATGLPTLEDVAAILVAGSVFAYGVTWVVKPFVTWVLYHRRGVPRGKAHGWIVRLVSVCVGALAGVGIASALGVGMVWGVVYGTGGGAMTTIAVGVKKWATRRLGGGGGSTAGGAS